MPSERAIVETLNRKELLELVTHFDLKVQDRRVRDNLIDALAFSRETRLDEILSQLSLASLKEVCRKHGLDDGGRLKKDLIARILHVPPATKKALARRSALREVPPPVVKSARSSKKPGAKASKVARAKPAAKAAPAAKSAPRGKKPVERKAASSNVIALRSDTAAKKPGRPPKAAKAAPAVAKPVAPKKPVEAKPPKAPRKVAKPAVSVAPVPPPAPVVRAVQPIIHKAVNRPPPPQTAPAVAAKPVASAAAPAPVAPTPTPTPAVAVAASTDVAAPASRPAPQRPPMELLRDTSLGAPEPPAASYRKCPACRGDVELRKCQVQKCSNYIVAHPARKICAECMFERNTLSMTDFLERLKEEMQCPGCIDGSLAQDNG